MDFNGKTVFITAGASGMGREFARRAAAGGANVVIADVDDAGAAELTASLPSALAVRCDVRDDAQVQAARDAALERFGQVDLVMSHAGITMIGALTQIADEDWTRILDLNLMGMVRVLRAFTPHLMDRKSGHVVMTSSSLALLSGHPLGVMAAPYIASKAAVIGLAHTAALMLAPHGVGVTVFAPDITDTGFAKRPAGAPPPPTRGMVPMNRQTPDQAVSVLIEALEKGRFLASATPDHERLLRLQAEALLDPRAMLHAYGLPAAK